MLTFAVTTSLSPAVSYAQLPSRESFVADSKRYLQTARELSAMSRVIEDASDRQIATDLFDLAMHAAERSAAVGDLLYLRSFVGPGAQASLAELFIRERMQFYAEATGPDIAALEAKVYRAKLPGLSDTARRLQEQVRAQKVLLAGKP